MEHTKRGPMNSILSVLIAVFRFIYGTGWIIERLLIALFRITLLPLIRFLSKCTPINVFNFICGCGERTIKVAVWIYTHAIKFVVWAARSLVSDFCWWAPGFAVALLIFAGVYFNSHAIALEVRVGGETISYVRNEEEFDTAVTKVEEDLAKKLGVNYTMYTQPEYRFVIVERNQLSEEENLYAQAYRAVTGEIGHHFALYVDGQRIAAVERKETIDKVLNEVKEQAVELYLDEDERKSPDLRVEFVKAVEVRSDLLSPNELVDEDTLRQMFDGSSNPVYYTIQEEDNLLEDVIEKTGVSRATIHRLNPGLDETKLIPNKTRLQISDADVVLGIKIVRTVEYDETIECSMKRIKNSDLYLNTTKVKKAGKDGSRHVVAEITEIDGKKEKRIISSVVTKEPVAGELYVGTKPYPTSHSSLAGTGAFIFPVPRSFFTSCPYGGYPGHKGIDYSRGGAYGQPVYASAGGTVISAGWSGGYGYCVRIRHSNGYVTLYAHCSSLLVSAGQSVTQGQQIARVGSTGNSTGPHLHFEIIINGRQVNPAGYVSK